MESRELIVAKNGKLHGPSEVLVAEALVWIQKSGLQDVVITPMWDAH